ncbi:Bialaphos biosynthetic pathway regulatory protein [Actinoplanes sp. SE50]|uniref:helix-turn-helix transcriptional regulator n=1 Tax=unclassified Actinoplanes TaxID=2626549 RepID=UPI00023EC869|nr:MULTISPECIES: helix-turn-helix transcriptional regulator [unclassified Actinoplanes]AEV87071.1 Bialaphos biosynthetic pathway regulatory protein [Actinoplanes sp. SE50/110]ATO85469.1 Bialaphos biosynthetic pathway regulatory protein [Actinoplanes sp. SE50]SLM02881.1 LuxR-family transcriptional regulator [Actinoplanes sp. SE50/110]
MIRSEDSLLGLDPVAGAVYRTLLANPDARLHQLGTTVGITDEQARDALDRLAELALVRRSEDDDQALPLLNDPPAALSTLLARQQVRMAEQQLEFERNKAAVAELLAASSAAGADLEPNEVERVLGLDAIRRRISELASCCREEVWTFNPDGAQSAQNRSSARPINEQTLQRGVQMRSIYLDSIRNDQPTFDHVQDLIDLGAEVRTTSTLPIRMTIVDRTTAVVPIDDRSSGRGALIITGRGMVAGLAALFVSTWQAARPLAHRKTREPGQPSEQERAALRLWAQGATDASVARTLGVSPRTVRRMSENLAERLRAKSRFEAGARAMEVGWLTAADFI